MSLFIATGSNLGDRLLNLETARDKLKKHFKIIAESRVYESPAVDYLAQPDFYNQVLEFHEPWKKPEEVLKIVLDIEKEMGRTRLIPKGPRLIDIDLLFWGDTKINTKELVIPHPRLFARSFVVLPLSELPGFSELEKQFHFSYEFSNSATPIIR